MCDLQLELQVDPKTAERIYELHSMKQAAVAAEDYDEAKRLKDSIARLKQVGQKLAQLEAQKKVGSVHDRCRTARLQAWQ
jgi:centrosomal protein CEP104